MTFKSAISIATAAIILTVPSALKAENHVGADTVVATVNGTEITPGHMLVTDVPETQDTRNL